MDWRSTGNNAVRTTHTNNSNHQIELNHSFVEAKENTHVSCVEKLHVYPHSAQYNMCCVYHNTVRLCEEHSPYNMILLVCKKHIVHAVFQTVIMRV